MELELSKNGYVEYNKELFLNDEIEIKIVKAEIERTNFTLHYDIQYCWRKIINGYTMLVCFDYTAKNKESSTRFQK